jgi:multiple sugar transport system substrate-binding protein
MNAWLRAAAIVLAAGVLGTGNASAADPAPRGKVTFLIAGEPAEKAAYVTLVEDFKRTHRAIQVQLVCMPTGRSFNERLLSDYAAGTPPDVFLMNYRQYGAFAARGVLEPLDAWAARSRLVDLGDFYTEALTPFRWNGALMAIPQNLSSLVVYYNKALFSKARLPYPKPGWTCDEFLKTAQALTRDLDGDGTTDQYGLGTEANLLRVTPFIWANGGDIVDDAHAPTRLTLDAPATHAALEWFIDLQIRHGVVPDLRAEQARGSEARFLDGTLAMFLNSRKGVPTYREACRFDWDVAPLPVGKSAATVLHSDGFFMAKASANKPAAWAFIEYANSVTGQTTLARTGRTVPSRRSVANSQAFLASSFRPRSSKVFLDVIPTIRPLPVIASWPDIESKVSDDLERAFHGAQTLDEAIHTTVNRTRTLFVNP